MKYFGPIIPDSYLIDGDSCLFFKGKKQNIKISAKEIIKYFKGVQK